MLPLPARLLSDADAASASSVWVHVGVLFGVLMVAWTMSLVGPVVSSLPDNVQTIFSPGVPTQIFQSVVGGVWIWVMTSLFVWKRFSHKGTQHQTVNAESSSWAAGKCDSKSAILHDNGLEDSTRNQACVPVSTGNTSGQGSHSSSIRDFVLSFVSHYRKPSFASHPTILPFVDL